MQKVINPISRRAPLDSCRSEDLSEDASTARGLNAQSSDNSGSHEESQRPRASNHEDAQNISIKTKFSKKATDILKAWLIEHIDHPYPSDEVKDELGRAAGLNRRQIQNWFTNTRKRYVQPLKKKLEESKSQADQLSENEPLKKNLKIFTSSSKSSQLTNALEKKMTSLKLKKQSSQDQDLEKTPSEKSKAESQEAPKQAATDPLPTVSSQTPSFLGPLNATQGGAFNFIVMPKPTMPISFVPINAVFGPAMNHYGQGLTTPIPVWPNGGMPLFMPNVITVPMVPSQTVGQDLPKQSTLKTHPVIQLERINTSDSTTNPSASPSSTENAIGVKVEIIKPNHEEIRDFAFKKVRKE